jgi:N-acetyltransferase
MTELRLENDLVLVRPIEMEDEQALAEVATDERIWEHIAHTLATKEDVKQYVAEQVKLIDKGERLVFVVIDKMTNKIIGSTSIYDISNQHAHCEVGSTWLSPTYWRTVVNTNCKYLLLRYIFEELQLERVQLKTDNLNERSQNAIERIGAKFEGRLRSHMRRKDGSMRDTMLYSIIREEWPEVKAMLESRISDYEDR